MNDFEIAKMLTPEAEKVGSSTLLLKRGTVKAINTNGTLSVVIDGSSSSNLTIIGRACNPSIGDRVIILVDGTQWTAIATVGGGGGRWHSIQYGVAQSIPISSVLWDRTLIPNSTLIVPNCNVGDNIFIAWSVTLVWPTVIVGETHVTLFVNGGELFNLSTIFLNDPADTSGRAASANGVYTVVQAGNQTLDLRFYVNVTAGTMRIYTTNVFAQVLGGGMGNKGDSPYVVLWNTGYTTVENSMWSGDLILSQPITNFSHLLAIYHTSSGTYQKSTRLIPVKNIVIGEAPTPAAVAWQLDIFQNTSCYISGAIYFPAPTTFRVMGINSSVWAPLRIAEIHGINL